ncbi:MAG: hypothetical protein FJZ04_03945 [Candidatus Moranbacteria bacterium]|nr:hypothetical protein [Candidatus Moranbacteria bacterium]
MLQILLYSALSFWLLTLIQTSAFPFWAGDWIFIGIFFWALYFALITEKIRTKIWHFWLPAVVGLGAASIMFYSPILLVPVAAEMAAFTYLIMRRKEWIFRFKEGFTAFLGIFLGYFIMVSTLRLQVFDYILTTGYVARILITFIVGFTVWIYLTLGKNRGKIR